ncbi:Na+/Ca+ antiporter, CaCA family [Alkalidesulfovibrio alkalitolerans DSM 16529]|uniref:Na+/Ca+ antiporter, CaCA family n=1 Tax=Alkalidesulfovibrio alkalitolerans DSM 16529 TaxID=1121439 RepID=S7TH65_9BACT|nr:calcium/sodium antiporter [Alkalidesulfovibrio alkalitolerans]EPR36156.1 Na+/Ca+ antiporter, CaCA family [Alkalidesulfovibrio alkalitolerans DSM 16529]
MIVALLSVAVGLALLVWSADRFVDGSAAVARHFGMPPLLIGMVVVGFGTSAPEMMVSALASWQGNPGIALGNAYGSNIANIALILGVSALISPIAVHSTVLRKELPILVAVTALTALLLLDGTLSRLDAQALLAVFAGLMAWTVRQGLVQRTDSLGAEMEQELAAPAMLLPRAVWRLSIGLALLIASSRVLVHGAVQIAQALGVGDLIIGLTIVAVGTSLPELASSVAAARKGEHDIALGNVLGSNLFNTLAVVGIAGAISPLAVPSEVLTRDVPVMGALTLSLFALGYGFGGRPGRINRFEGVLLLVCFFGYTVWLAAAG